MHTVQNVHARHANHAKYAKQSVRHAQKIVDRIKIMRTHQNAYEMLQKHL